MFFNAFSTSDIACEEIKNRLRTTLNNYECNEFITKQKVEKLLAALDVSGNDSFASRYGLTQISFAQTEMMNALSRTGGEVEFLNYRYDFKDIPMNHKRSDFPLVLAIEASSLCNLKCRMCFQNNKEFSSNPANIGVMEWNTYEKLMGQIGQGQLRSIVFASRGEPLINKNIHKMVALAKQKGVLDVKLNTNAVLLNEELSRNLLAAGLDQIVFSVDSVVLEHYKNIRGADFDKVSENVRRFAEIRKTEFPEAKIKTRVSAVINDIYKDQMEREVQLSKEFWDGVVDEVAFKSENDFSGIYRDHDVEDQKCCDLLWERLYIWRDGTVNPCDIDHLSTLKVGNIYDEPVSEIWNGEKMEQLRKQHLCSRDRMQCVCKNCVGY